MVTSYERPAIALAIGLSCLAGYVDASGFLATGGLFVSFMSGNSTRFSIAFADQRFTYAGLVLGVIALFVLGVMLGTAVSRLTHRLRKTAVLFLVGCLLIAGAICHSVGQTYLSTGLMVLAMGAENAVFQRDGEVSIGLTYMTGTLVRLGQHLTASFFGGSRTAWIPYAFHWFGLAVGAILGGWGHSTLRAFTLWPAVGAAFILCLFSLRLRTTSSQTIELNPSA